MCAKLKIVKGDKYMAKRIEGKYVITTIDESSVNFEAVKGAEISLCVRYCIKWLRVTNRKEGTLTFNDIDLTIRQHSYFQDKVDEYYYKSNVRTTLDPSTDY